MKKETLKKEHIDMQFLALSVSVLAFLGLAYFSGEIVWIQDFQAFITLISGVFALFIGVVALLRYYTKRSYMNFLFVGIGFIGVGLLDIFQVVLDIGGFSNLFMYQQNAIYPVASVLSKAFLAILMFLSWFVSKGDSKGTKRGRKKELLLMGMVAVFFALFIGVFIFLVLKGIEVASLAVVIIGLFSLLLLILALLGYLFKKGWLYDDFNYWIIFTLCFLILSQIFYLPFLNLEYFNMMNLSVWSRFFAYLGLLTGFLNSIYVMYQREVLIQKELEKKNSQLDTTKAKVEEAYLILRQEKWDLAKSKGSADRILKDIVKGK